MYRRSFLSTQRDRQKPLSHTCLQMRSALVGTASNVVALKTTAAVPMSVIERMFHLLCGVLQQRCAITCVPRKVLVYFLKWRTFFEFRAEHFSMQLFRVGAKLTTRPLSHQWS